MIWTRAQAPKGARASKNAPEGALYNRIRDHQSRGSRGACRQSLRRRRRSARDACETFGRGHASVMKSHHIPAAFRRQLLE
jgi:hypothetical protein